MGDNLTQPAPLAPLTAIPPDLRSVSDYERRAERHMPADSWRHIQEGAQGEATLRHNRARFDELRFLPKILADLTAATSSTRLAGRDHAAPILLAPLAYQRIAHPDGELATIRAATAIGLGTILSTLSSVPLEEIAAAGRDAARELGGVPGPLWFQLYLQPQREDSLSLVRRAEQAGYEAIVLTIDAGIKPSSFILPSGVDAANLRSVKQTRHVAAAGNRLLFGTDLLAAMPSWEDVDWLRRSTALPIFVKGMYGSADARRLIDAGVDGLVLSNHGGRVLDGLPHAIDLLPEIAAVARGKVSLLADGGVRRGGDIVKLLCLGADAVLIGRPVLYGLAVAGMPGVAHVLHLLRAEFELTMAQLGCGTIADLTNDRLRKNT